MGKIKRREFVKSAALGMAAAPLLPLRRGQPLEAGERNEKKKPAFGLGLASYTFREFNLEQTIEMAKRLGLPRISLKSFHLPLETSEVEIRAAAQKVRNAGIDLYGCGVVYMTSHKEVSSAFAYAKAAGMRLIIGVPNHELLGLVENAVKEFDIRLAIHNHGPEDKLYPTPESVVEKIMTLDRRIGLCIDAGHTMRAGVDPAEPAEKFADRLLDVHIKDVSAASKEGQTVEIGRGVIDIPKFIRALVKANYSGTLAFEFEKDEKDPLPGVAESVGYVRGVLAAL